MSPIIGNNHCLCWASNKWTPLLCLKSSRCDSLWLIMALMKTRMGCILLLCTFASSWVSAKRIPIKPVPPVTVNGVQYSAEDGNDSYVIATDAATRKILWKVKVFHNRVHWWRGEEDNQWIFITDLKLAGKTLIVRDEKNRCYSIQLDARPQANKSACNDIFPSEEPRR